MGLPALVSQRRKILIPLTLASERMVSGREGLALNIPPINHHLCVGIGAGWGGAEWLLLLTQLSAERRVPHPDAGQNSGEEQKEDQR